MSTLHQHRCHHQSQPRMLQGKARASTPRAPRTTGRHATRPVVVRSAPSPPPPSQATSSEPAIKADPAADAPVAASASGTSRGDEAGSRRSRGKRQADSTDAVASFLTRRFGLAGGLAWLGFLAVGSLGEQVKTRLEVAQEEQGTRDVQDAPVVTLPSGVSYQDLKVGGGSAPIKSYLAVVHYVGKANGEVFEDTRARGKPIVYLYGSRPFTGGLCAGVEQAMASMKAGGRRIIKVPASAGFGENGTVLQPTNHVADKSGIIPGGAELEYDVELLRVSIPPS